MRRFLLVAALLAVAIPGMGQAGESDAEQDVSKLSRQITDAMVKGDTKFLDGVMADDWVMVSPEGAFEDKAMRLREITDGSVNYESMDKSELKTRVFGDAAVVTGHIRSRLKVRGQLLGGSVSFTEVFIKREGKWRSVSVQLTHIAALAREKL